MKSLLVPSQQVNDLSEASLRDILTNRGVAVNVNEVNWSDYSYAPSVSLSLLSGEAHLFAMYTVKEKHILARALEDNGNVWEDSCVEIFIGDSDGKHYYNFEINCIGTLLAARRLSVSDYHFIVPEEYAKIIKYSSLPHEPIDCSNEEVGEWSVIVGIPYSVLGMEEKPKRLRVNFYKCGDATAEPHFLSWNPIKTDSPNFHIPKYFGELIINQK